MPKYEIEVCRTSYGFFTFEVNAANLEAAKKYVQEHEGDELYSEKSADYEIVSSREVPEDK